MSRPHRHCDGQTALPLPSRTLVSCDCDSPSHLRLSFLQSPPEQPLGIGAAHIDRFVFVLRMALPSLFPPRSKPVVRPVPLEVFPVISVPFALRTISPSSGPGVIEFVDDRARQASFEAVGSGELIRDMRRGRVPSVDRFRSLCQVLGLDFYVGPHRDFASVDERRLELAVETTERALEESGVILDAAERSRVFVGIYQLIGDKGAEANAARVAGQRVDQNLLRSAVGDPGRGRVRLAGKAAGVAQRLPVRRPVARAGESASIDKRFWDQDRVAVQCVEVTREPAKAQPQHPRSEVRRGAR